MKLLTKYSRMAFAVFVCTAVLARAEAWRQMPIRGLNELQAGRYGGEGEQLFHGFARCESDPKRVYLNQDVYGVWRSSDGGVSWDKAMDRGMHCVKGWSLMVDPVNPDLVMAFEDMDNTWYEFSDKYKGLYRSVNGGDDWVRVLDVRGNIEWDFDRKLHRCLAFDPVSVDAQGATRWYFAAQSGEYTKDYYQSSPGIPVWSYGGVYKSEDRGVTWVAQNTNMAGYIRIDAIVPHPADSNKLFLASNRGLSVSTNQGVSFEPFGDIPTNYWISSFAVNPVDSEVLYAYAFTNIFRGETVPGIYNAGVWNDTYGMGLYKSMDGGAHFELMPGTAGYLAVAMNAGNPDILYLNGLGKVPKVSFDGGSNWVSSVINPDVWIDTRNRRPQNDQTGFAGCSTNPLDVVAFGSGSIFRSTDGGLTFDPSRTKFTGFYQAYYEAGFIFDRFDPNRFGISLADVTMVQTETGSRYFELTGHDEILDWYANQKVIDYSGAGGTAKTNRLIPWYYSVSADYHPVQGSDIIVSSIGYVFDNYLMRSADRGKHWEIYRETPQGTNSYASLARLYSFIGFDKNSPDTVYAGDKVSFDTGITWTNLPPDGNGKRVEVVDICYSPTGTVVFGLANYNRTLYRSADPVHQGWQLFFDASKTTGWKFSGVDSMPILSVHPTDPDVVCVPGPAGNKDLVFLTRSGTNVNIRYTGLIGQSGGAAEGNWMSSVVFDPRHPEVVYAAFGAPGLPNVYRSVDGGTNWVNIVFNRPLDGGPTMAVSPYTGELLGGSLAGTWVLPPPYEGPTPIYDNLYYFGPVCTNTTPPTVPAGLTGAALSEQAIELTWEESTHDGGGIMKYEIARDGQPVGTSYTLSYTDTHLAELTDYDYSVRTVSLASVPSGWSSNVTVSTAVDTNPPVIVRVFDTVNAAHVAVEFSEPLDAASAENAANYTVNGATVISAVLSGQTVTLTTTAMSAGTHTLTVSGVRDASSRTNLISPGSQGSFINRAPDYPQDPLAWWTFDGSAQDVAGTNNGAWLNGPASYGDGRVGRAAALNGTTNGPYVEVPESASLEGMSNLTVSIWARKNDPLVGGQLFKKHISYDLFLNGTTYTFDGYVRNQTNEFADLHVKDLPGVQDTAWHHYAVTYDESFAVGHVDGAEVVRTALPGTAINAPVDRQALRIGKNPWGDLLSFAGNLDEMKIFTRALTPVEIQALAAEGPTVVAPSDADADGLPNFWEKKYSGGITNADAGSICANGIHTYLEAYIAGLNPADPSAEFRVSLSSGNSLQWQISDGRTYDVLWTSNLFLPFQLFTNISSGGSFTDTLHGAYSNGFYRLNVRLTP